AIWWHATIEAAPPPLAAGREPRASRDGVIPGQWFHAAFGPPAGPTTRQLCPATAAPRQPCPFSRKRLPATASSTPPGPADRRPRGCVPAAGSPAETVLLERAKRPAR